MWGINILRLFKFKLSYLPGVVSLWFLLATSQHKQLLLGNHNHKPRLLLSMRYLVRPEIYISKLYQPKKTFIHTEFCQCNMWHPITIVHNNDSMHWIWNCSRQHFPVETTILYVNIFQNLLHKCKRVLITWYTDKSNWTKNFI